MSSDFHSNFLADCGIQSAFLLENFRNCLSFVFLRHKAVIIYAQEQSWHCQPDLSSLEDYCFNWRLNQIAFHSLSTSLPTFSFLHTFLSHKYREDLFSSRIFHLSVITQFCNKLLTFNRFHRLTWIIYDWVLLDIKMNDRIELGIW